VRLPGTHSHIKKYQSLIINCCRTGSRSRRIYRRSNGSIGKKSFLCVCQVHIAEYLAPLAVGIVEWDTFENICRRVLALKNMILRNIRVADSSLFFAADTFWTQIYLEYLPEDKNKSLLNIYVYHSPSSFASNFHHHNIFSQSMPLCSIPMRE